MSRRLPASAPIIRAARPSDADDIVRVVRTGFAPAELDLMIYACPGIDRFIALQLTHAECGSDTAYTVAQDDAGRVVGAIELRLGSTLAFLNYISVEPAWRSSGLARRMFRDALAGLPSSCGVINLDVSEHNGTATGWYERLGFERVSRGEWWSAPINADAVPAEAPAAVISGFPQAHVCHDAFGFSQVTLTTSAGAYTLGRLGDRWVRVTDPAALADPAVPAAVARLGMPRLLTNVDPRQQETGIFGPAERIHGTYRMSAPLPSVRNALA